MKRLEKLLGGLIAVALTVFSLQSVAADAQSSGRNFNHMSTGFVLTGGHAIAACETCHVGGVFKGTPRECDGCHANGKRIVATPKNSAHIVTEAQCDACHFNSASFLGARYNHANAIKGQCQTCHNGRLSAAKPATHSAGNKASKSCDSCHRSVAWLPATWNHDASSAGICTTCHINGVEVSAPNRKPAGHSTTSLKNTLQCDACHNYISWLPARYKHTSAAACSTCHNNVDAVGKTGTHTTTAKATYACNDCHRSTVSWLPARYNHTSAAACSSCHNATIAIGAPTSHPSFSGWPTECNQCHLNTNSFAGALGAKPANHIPYNSGVGCIQCHTTGIGNAIVKGATLHAYVSTFTCRTCHLSGTTYLGKMDKKGTSHENMGSKDCSASGCHRPLGNTGSSYTVWD